MDSRALGAFLAIGPFVVAVECFLARLVGWSSAPLLASWRGAALAVACWEWAAIAWMHAWLNSGGAKRLLARAPRSRLARLLARRR